MNFVLSIESGCEQHQQQLLQHCQHGHVGLTTDVANQCPEIGGREYKPALGHSQRDNVCLPCAYCCVFCS